MGFTGITKEVFDYFFEPGDKETRLSVKRMIGFFAEELQPRVKGINPWYSDQRPGNLNSMDDHCWVAFGPQEPKGAFKYFAHVTVSITSGGVEVFINIEVKDAVDKLRKAIALKEPLLKILRSLRSGGFEIQLKEREQRLSAGRTSPRPNAADRAASSTRSPASSPTSTRLSA